MVAMGAVAVPLALPSPGSGRRRSQGRAGTQALRGPHRRPEGGSLALGQCGGRGRGAVQVRLRAGEDSTPSADAVDENILEYCSIEPGVPGKRKELTMGEKEAEFLFALQSFYVTGRASMTDEEFDNLKEELTWEGSSVATLSTDELRFLEATRAFRDGKSIISDAEYDALKLALKTKGSAVALEGPRCSLRSRKVTSDAEPDYLKMVALRGPALALTIGVLFSIDEISELVTGRYELTDNPILEADLGGTIFGPLAFIFLPLTIVISFGLTRLALGENPLVLHGPCPACGDDVVTYFGKVFGVDGYSETAELACKNCKSELTLDSKTRTIELIKDNTSSGAA